MPLRLSRSGRVMLINNVEESCASPVTVVGAPVGTE